MDAYCDTTEHSILSPRTVDMAVNNGSYKWVIAVAGSAVRIYVVSVITRLARGYNPVRALLSLDNLHALNSLHGGQVRTREPWSWLTFAGTAPLSHLHVVA